MRVIIVTGTPGTGKTALSKELAEKTGCLRLDVNEIISKYMLSEGYDKKRETKIIDTKKLNKALIKEIKLYKKLIQNNIRKASMPKKPNKKSYNGRGIKKKKKIINDKIKKIRKGIIIDSHLSHYLPAKYVDLCIVAKCDLNELKKRLKKRRYGEDKIRENLDAEIFDVCLTEAKENNHKIFVINTTKGINIDTISHKLGGLIGI